MTSQTLLEIWEWRGFWPEEADCFSFLSPDHQKAFAEAATQTEDDIYLVLPDNPSGVKCRGNQLEVKPFANAQDGCKAFHPKRVDAFPLSPDHVASLFPDVPAPVSDLKDIYALADHLDAQPIHTQKERRKIKARKGVLMEYCHLWVEENPFHSLCLEGLDLQDILTEAKPLRQDDMIETDYVSFIRDHFRDPVL